MISQRLGNTDINIAPFSIGTATFGNVYGKTDNLELGKINIKSQSSRANESPTNANYRGAGLSQMAYSIENNKLHLCNGKLSLHVLDIIRSIMTAAKNEKTEIILTKCSKPDAFTQEEIKKLLK